MYKIITFFLLTFIIHVLAEDAPFSITNHSVVIEEKVINYVATAGNLIIKDENDKDCASIFYVAYTKNDEKNLGERPLAFCFNGGPGSSSVWLHLGAFGPKRILFDENGCAHPPYTLVDNEQSLLDVTDLVFIDPVSTGFSRACLGEDEKQFHGVHSDVESIAQFIRLYITKNNRWESPKYLAGESYGTTRAAFLANFLHEEHYIYCKGVILISTVLNFQTLDDRNNGNDLPYILYLPTYTRTAAFHNKLLPELQENLDQTIQDVEHFALHEYATALMLGDQLDESCRESIVKKLSLFTGLSKEFVEQSNLRIHNMHFSKELLRSSKRTVGRFDSQYKGIDVNVCGEVFEYDPSSHALIGAFTASFNHYVKCDLKYDRDEEYKIVAHVFPWKYDGGSNQYLNSGDALREVMTKNPKLKVFVASGYYDLATPYFATDYTFNHLNLDKSLRSNITTKYYEGGHMMYVQYPLLEKLKKDIAEYFRN